MRCAMTVVPSFSGSCFNRDEHVGTEYTAWVLGQVVVAALWLLTALGQRASDDAAARAVSSGDLVLGQQPGRGS